MTIRAFIIPFVFLAANASAEAIWKPEDISFRIYESHPALGKGYVLELNQTLHSGEHGWTQSRLDIPESWSNASVRMDGGIIVLSTSSGDYFVGPSNKGGLQFEILDGGNKTDEELISIWRKNAQTYNK